MTLFITHCESIGINLLSDDIKHIKKCLRQIPKHEQKNVLHRYIEIWQFIMGECEDSLCAQNLGRRAANTFLTEL